MSAAPPPAAEGSQTLPHVFRPYTLRGLTLRNRFVLSPMNQYSCEARDGFATDWHFVHLGTRAAGGVGLVFAEGTSPSVDGRITPEELGYWSDAHAEALARTVDFVHAQGAAMGLQLAHAGRKGSVTRPWEGNRAVPAEQGGWTPWAPSAIPYSATYPMPREATEADIRRVIREFGEAADRAVRFDIDVLEIHGAHGYLLHQFLSPLSNQRTDCYGGCFENRIRLLLEVVDEVRGAWPADRPLFVRLSCTDWAEGGWTPDDTVRLAPILAEHGVDLVDCSSGGLTPTQQVPYAPDFQTQFAARVKRETGVPTGAVGFITSAERAEAILAADEADLIFMARELLRDPFLPIKAARSMGVPEANQWPKPYLRAREVIVPRPDSTGWEFRKT